MSEPTRVHDNTAEVGPVDAGPVDAGPVDVGNDTGHSATVAYRVRFDECGPGDPARASAYLRYAQDVAWIHSERLGFDRAWYDARSVIWVVRAITLDILSPSVTADVLSVRTRVVGFRRVWARRVTDFRAPDGSLRALARTDWVMIDMRGVPTRVPEAITSRFHGGVDPGVSAIETGPMEPIRLGPLEVPEDAAELRLQVRPQEVDPQAHVNNAVWIDWVDEAVVRLAGSPRADAARRYVLEYVASATLGADLVASAWREDDGSFGCTIRERSAPGTLSDRLRARVGTLSPTTSLEALSR